MNFYRLKRQEKEIVFGSDTVMKRVVAVVLGLGLCLTMLSGCKKDDESTSSTVSMSSGLSSSELSSSSVPVTMIKVAVVKGAPSGLNVRSSASSEGEKIATVKNDDKFRLVGEAAQDGWYQIQYIGQNAYISEEYAEIREISEADMLKLESDRSTTASKDEEIQSGDEDTGGDTDEDIDEDTDTGVEGSDLNTRDIQDVE